MFQDTLTTLSRLEAIRDLGVRIAIDDFGTGYSSLGYLRRFRVDILKIARDFIGPAEREEEWAFASAIVAIGRSLGRHDGGRGDRGDRASSTDCRRLGCELGQGYLFARPGRCRRHRRPARGRAPIGARRHPLARPCAAIAAGRAVRLGGPMAIDPTA